MTQRRKVPEYVVGHVKQALAEEAGMGELDLEVAVRDDRVFISGEVATEERRRAITDLLETMLPDYEIHNQVAVTDVEGPRPAEDIS